MKMKKVNFNMCMSNGVTHGVQIYSEKLKDFFIKSKDDYNFLYIEDTKFLSIYRIVWNLFILPVKTQGESIYSFSSHGTPFNKNQIITIHDLICFEFPEQHKFQYYYFKYLLPKILKSTKKIVVISNFTKKEVLKYYNLSEDKVVVIHNGLNQLNYQFNDETEAQYKSTISNRPYFITVGASYKHKNIENLLCAIEKLSDINCDFIIISKNNTYGMHLRQLAKNKKLNNVIFLESVSLNLLTKLYQNAICNIYISLYEGFGFPPLEAASLGTISLVSDIEVMREVLGDSAIYTNPNNLGEIVRKIEEIYNNKINLNKIRSTFPELLSKYSWSETGKRVEQMVNMYLK